MSYAPDASAVAQQQTLRFTRFLSLRELSLLVPVNFVTQPGIALTPACFARGRYTTVAAANCLSNLLAAGFRRVEADIYWDPSRSHWSLCPVQLGGVTGQDGQDGQDGSTSAVTAATTTTPLSTTTQFNTAFITSRAAFRSNHVNLNGAKAVRRQTSDFTSSSSSSTAPQNAVTSASINNTPTTALTAPSGVTISDGTLLDIGPYSCTTGTDVDLLVDVISAYLEDTENKLNSTTIVLTLNVHAATPLSDPTGSALEPSPDQLPGPNSLLSNIVAGNSSAYLYTPRELLEERSDLNASGSWFAVTDGAITDPAFFQIDADSSGDSTLDGWPSEIFIEREQFQRILVGFGSVDPQMSGYNFAADGSYIFPSGYLQSSRPVMTTSTGKLTDGCFFSPDSTSLTSQNSSWAIANIGNGSVVSESALPSILALAGNLTGCGISPILNYTLNDTSADENATLYIDFVQSTVWSWATDQPVNSSTSPELSDHRCASMNATSGSWEASDCGASQRGACRIGTGPYTWRISNAQAAYETIDLACDDGTSFDTPRTSLENTYLLSAWRTWQSENADDEPSPLLWLDFNDLDVAGCWVVGQNASCPYINDAPSTDKREVIVPVVGGIVVLVLAVLTVLVKCAGNRQQSKRRRRRGDDGWDYEGVPS